MINIRGAAIGLLAVTLGCGLAVQQWRMLPWTDAAGTVLYVVAAALLVAALRPRWSPVAVATIAGAVSCVVELTQLTGWTARVANLPLGDTTVELVGRILRLAVGTTFSWVDLGWLIAATPVAWLVIRMLHLGSMPRPSWSAGLILTSAGLAMMIVPALVPAHEWPLGVQRSSLPWTPVVVGLSVVIGGLGDVWRGLSRDDRRPSAESLPGRIAAGLGISAMAALLVPMVVRASSAVSPQLPVAVAAAATVLLGVVLTVVAGWGDGVPQRGRAVAASVLAVMTILVATGLGQLGPSTPSPSGEPRATPYPSVVRPVPTAAPVPSINPGTEVTPPPPAPKAPAGTPLCRVEQLEGRTQGWDSAMFKTWVTVVVTNTSTEACAVQGLPDVSLLQGRSPVELTTDRHSASSPGTSERPRRALVRPGGEVSVLLFWDGYRTQADLETPQALTLHAPGVGSLPVELDRGPAPFDLMDGGRVSVSAWQ